MSSTADPLRRDQRISLRLECACDFTAVRTASLAARDWLAEKGLPETELGAWELTLVEAANNAVNYAGPEGRRLPVSLELFCGEHEVEARITDHTDGFDWPDDASLPAAESESGRGLFLIKSLSDHALYLRAPGHNVLVLRRRRAAGTSLPLPDSDQLLRRLAESESALADMTAELASSYESLVALFRYSAELGAQPDYRDFSHRLLRDLMQLAEADSAVLRLLSADGRKLETLLVHPKPVRPLPAVSYTPTAVSLEVGAARQRQDLWFEPAEPLAETDPLRAVMPVGSGVCHAFFVANQLVGTATLGRRATGRPFTAAQVNLLHTFIDFLAIQIVNARLLDERTATRVTRRELEIAADIQRSLLPGALPACPPFALAAACQNALQVGGDFYDVIMAGDGALLLVIADVMGKGVPAALFAAVLRSTVRSMPQLFAQPAALLGAANRTLFPDLSRVDMFATVNLVYLDPARQQILSASAGHCPLLVWQSTGRPAMASGQSGFPLGIEPQVTYEQTTTTLAPGAAVLLYTDGVSEARNAAAEMLGENRLLELFTAAAAAGGDADSGLRSLLEQLAAERGPAPLADDQTLIFIRNHP